MVLVTTLYSQSCAMRYLGHGKLSLGAEVSEVLLLFVAMHPAVYPFLKSIQRVFSEPVESSECV